MPLKPWGVSILFGLHKRGLLYRKEIFSTGIFQYSKISLADYLAVLYISSTD